MANTNRRSKRNPKALSNSQYSKIAFRALKFLKFDKFFIKIFIKILTFQIYKLLIKMKMIT